MSKQKNTGCIAGIFSLIVALITIPVKIIVLLISAGAKIISGLYNLKFTLRGGLKSNALVALLFLISLVCGINIIFSAASSGLRSIGILSAYTPTPSPTLILSPTATNTSTNTPLPTDIPSPTATLTPTPRPKATHTPAITITATSSPTVTPAPLPTATSAPPTSTPQPATPTPQPATATPAPPTATPAPPTATPAPPTATPAPQRDYLAPGVWWCPNSLAGAAYVGSIGSDKFHYPGCYQVKQIIASNRICFQDRASATNYGYLPCGHCKP